MQTAFLQGRVVEIENGNGQVLVTARFKLIVEIEEPKLQGLQDSVTRLFAQGDYLQGLNQLAELRPAVDRFFDEVMVMVDDERLKDNRLALLEQLLQSFRKVADFSRIQS